MQIEVITESGSGDSSEFIPHLIARLKQTDDGMPVVHANAYAVDGLLDVLDIRASRGERKMVVMGCSQDQIQAVLRWRSENRENDDLDDLVIHLVRQKDSWQETADADEA